MIDEVTPTEAMQALESNDSVAMIDVRTQEEWEAVGVPDISATGHPLWLVEWVHGPSRLQNPSFLKDVLRQAGDRLPDRIFFICRSGARSAAAAQAVAALAEQMGQSVQCTNVAEGFEGAPAYGAESGWKGRGLPWKR